jgi:hypothetical protein
MAALRITEYDIRHGLEVWAASAGCDFTDLYEYVIGEEEWRAGC